MWSSAMLYELHEAADAPTATFIYVTKGCLMLCRWTYNATYSFSPNYASVVEGSGLVCDVGCFIPAYSLTTNFGGSAPSSSAGQSPSSSQQKLDTLPFPEGLPALLSPDSKCQLISLGQDMAVCYCLLPTLYHPLSNVCTCFTCATW